MQQRPAQRNWEHEARNILKAELARTGVTYKVLVGRLEKMGIHVNEAAVASRLSRGMFSFAFFLQCMSAIGVETVHLAGGRGHKHPPSL